MPIHEIKPLVLHYRIHIPPEPAAGLPGGDDEVTIIVESGNPGGEPGEFAEYMRQCLAEWCETDQVELIGGNNEPKNSDVR